MMARRLIQILTVATALAALAAVVGGCGSGDSSTSSSISTFTSPTLTKKEYVKQANELCEKAEKKRFKTLEVAVAKLEESNGTYSQLIEEYALPEIRLQIEELGQLTPPEADAEQVEEMLDQMTTALEESEEDAKTFENGEPFAKADKSAEAYGLTSCRI